ncbi:DegT/DnrJ/EryC1/StrS family aminotransferase [Bacillus sp. UMB0893]|uniref:DegT/DnrJ/EryC1/StrS family aminotransferase n=1 Tax=Bacillus sp. UMB0893 TaxID=2066053 RepID=UPI000C7694C2|nr:aminotransferase class I/II-fold pyridoxal phosphate-dependent enzyme [Bacillus sp. UMB0893]PLR68861.1 pyridoxal phosphate-dependent aminotransferase [Bacillus sp. UMB0893]
MGEKEQSFIKEAFEKNWIAPVGPNINLFEKELADYVGIKGAVALSSGTAALHLALRYLGVGVGDTVFCSTFTFVASANPILYQGAEPIFIDSEPDSWNISPDALKYALSEAEKSGKLPKAVIVVNLYGQSADMDPLLEICNQFNVPIIEDAAESLGATYKGKASGTIGEFGIYSFNGNKIITTSNGGMLVSDNLEALEKARFWSTQAKENTKHYQHKEIGYNYRLSNILAGIGRGQLMVLNDRINSRRKIFQNYFSELSNIDGIAFMKEANFGRSTHWLTALTIDPDITGTTVENIIDALEAHNIEARRLWKPMHLQPLYKTNKYYPHEKERSISDELFDKGICLPSGSNLTENEQSRIIELIKNEIH